MAAKDDAEGGDFDTPVYRLVLFFVLILAIDTIWELIDEHVTHTIRKRQHKGLVHAWEQLKFEVMALGLVSLLLVVCEVRMQHPRGVAVMASQCTSPARQYMYRSPELAAKLRSAE